MSNWGRAYCTVPLSVSALVPASVAMVRVQTLLAPAGAVCVKVAVIGAGSQGARTVPAGGTPAMLKFEQAALWLVPVMVRLPPPLLTRVTV